MTVVEPVIIILSCVCLSNTFGLYGLGNSYKLLLKELNSSLTLFDSSAINTKWIGQPLDHFNNSDIRIWKMRYFERLDYWKRDGPIYLFINGEAEASNGFLQTGILYDLAQETNGAMYLSEHRYYGNSKPFNDFSTQNLKYLSSQQALADVASLLKNIKKVPKYRKSKVVVVGGSYAGNLAAWMKLLYPNLVDAVIASSAPVLAKKDFYAYLENVSDDFEQYGTSGCLEKISEIFRKYDEMFKTQSGIKQLKEEEKICSNNDMTKPENRHLFFLHKTFTFMIVAQYGTPDSIKKTCEQISTTSHVLSSKEDDTAIWKEKKNCFDYDFDNMIESMKNDDEAFSWMYQTCTEFGYYQTTSSDKQPFTKNIPLEFYLKCCTQSFGPEFNEDKIDAGVAATNRLYGGLKPNVTKVVFVNGDLDPYHRLGVLEDISYEAPAKVIPASSHCRDLFSDSPTDPEELKESRRYIKYLIKKWIGAGEFKKTRISVRY